MLDAETRRRIDAARALLVGKVPDPKAQVEQITIALIYKFMDDMDAEAARLGRERRFFVGEFAKFGWSKLMAPHLDGAAVRHLYTEAVTRMDENAGVPPLFRTIFQHVHVPYRDSATLQSFLKMIDGFEYDHAERLGDAFEYLLSILGSQGDAGQFRTPRHMIDFMVQIINPQKHETILDPACGTAGFLIAAYKQILQQNMAHAPGDLLTADERARLMQNIQGYDISPDMVRLSLVNLYLHGFSDPHIFEYDTLTSQARWHEFADVVLANPPFMSPTGGIKPHKDFAIQSKRSEVLFVDYITAHLTPNGRAAILVPEGIIFQGQRAYQQLRQRLVKQDLYGVVSLPPGVFQPYSGVKTSILLLDRTLARQSDTILFVKVENDGFDLGAPRHPHAQNDLPAALTAIQAYAQNVRNGTPFDARQHANVLVVTRERIGHSGEWNLSGARYRADRVARSARWPMAKIGDLCELARGRVISKKYIAENPGPYPVYSSQTHHEGILGHICTYDFEGEYVTWTTDGAKAGTVFYRNGKFSCTNVCGALTLLPENAHKVDMRFLANVLNHVAHTYVVQLGNPKLMNKEMAQVQIPLPPLEVQRAIVAEIEGHRAEIARYELQIQGRQAKIAATISRVWARDGKI